MITIRNYIKATSLEQAWQLNQQRGSRIVGGMLWLKMGTGNVQTAIDLSDLSLDRIEETEEEFRIGCMVSLRQLEQHPGLAVYTGGAMKEALRHIVGVQFRNLATVGGSIFGRYGFSDVLTMFLVMDSYVELYAGGIVPLREFSQRGYDRDVLVRMIVKKEPARFVYSSVRNARTDFPVLTCGAACLENQETAYPEDQEGACLENQNAVCLTGRYRFSIGARPGKAILTEDQERILTGEVTEEKAAAFGRFAAGRVPTGSNLRGSAEYRSHLVEVLCTRAAIKLGGQQNADQY